MKMFFPSMPYHKTHVWCEWSIKLIKSTWNTVTLPCCLPITQSPLYVIPRLTACSTPTPCLTPFTTSPSYVLKQQRHCNDVTVMLQTSHGSMGRGNSDSTIHSIVSRCHIEIFWRHHTHDVCWKALSFADELSFSIGPQLSAATGRRYGRSRNWFFTETSRPLLP